MKPRRQLFRRSSGRLHTALSTLSIALCFTGAANAASQAWRAAPVDSTWAGTSNWGATGTVTPPGIFPTTNATNTADVATFNAALSGGIGGSGNPIVIDANRMIGSLLFDTANAGSYVVGTNTSLQVGNNLSITVNAAVVNPQVVNANLQLHLPSSTNGAYTIQNNSTTSTATLTLQGSTGNPINSTRGSAWTIGGANTGANTISSTINLTTTGGIASTLTKAGAGQWILSGTNTIGGGTTISAGTLRGGSKTNVVPDFCVSTVDIRLVPGQDAAFEEALFARLRHVCPDLEISVSRALPLYTDPEHPLLQKLNLQGAAAVGAPWFCDAAVFASHGSPAIAMGPGSIAQAHTRDEWIALEDLEKGAAFFEAFLRSLQPA